MAAFHFAPVAGSDRPLTTTRQDLRLPSIPQLQETLRAALWKDILQGIEKGTTDRKIARNIKELVEP